MASNRHNLRNILQGCSTLLVPISNSNAAIATGTKRCNMRTCLRKYHHPIIGKSKSKGLNSRSAYPHQFRSIKPSVSSAVSSSSLCQICSCHNYSKRGNGSSRMTTMCPTSNAITCLNSSCFTQTMSFSTSQSVASDSANISADITSIGSNQESSTPSSSSSSSSLHLDLEKETISSLSSKAYALSLNEMEQIITQIETDKIKNDGSNGTDVNNASNQFMLNEQNIQYIHKLMTACAQFQTIQGAELTERFLAAVTSNYDVTKKYGNEGEEDETEQYYLGPTSKMYSIAMNAWAQLNIPKEQQYNNNNSNNDDDHHPIPGERALQILEFMWQEYFNSQKSNNETITTIKPDVIHYTIVLTALSKTNSRKAIHLAQSLLDEAEQRSGVHFLLSDDDDNTRHDIDANLVPDRMCYNTVLYLWSNYFNSKNDIDNQTRIRNNRNNANKDNNIDSEVVFDKMKRIIDQMDKLGLVLNDESWLPNTKSYNFLLRACSFPNLPNSILEAEGILKTMNEKQLERHQLDHVSPNLDFENILELQEDNALPNIHTYNALLQVYAKAAASSGSSDSNDVDSDMNVAQAREILKSLLKSEQVMGIEEGKDNDHHQDLFTQNIQPNLVTINTYLNVLVNSGRSDAIYEAESLLYFLSDLRDDYKSPSSSSSLGILDDAESKEILRSLAINLDSISYSTVIHGFANCSEKIKHSAQNANMILLQMIKRSQGQSKGGDSLTPSESCFLGVINAWINEAKLEKDGSKFLNAEAVLMQMEQNEFYVRNTSVLNSLLSITGLNFEDESEKKKAASGARRVLLRMIERCSHHDQAKPDIYSFNNVIKANVGFKEDINIREALFSAIDTFNALNNSHHCEPNDQTYIHMFKILQNSAEEEVEVEIIYEELFQKCCKSGLMTNAVLRIIENMISPTSLRRLEDCKTKKDGKLVVNNLPPEWSENRRKGQNQRRNRKQSWRRR